MALLTVSELPILPLDMVGCLVGVVVVQVPREACEQVVVSETVHGFRLAVGDLELGIGENGLATLSRQLLAVGTPSEQLVQ